MTAVERTVLFRQLEALAHAIAALRRRGRHLLALAADARNRDMTELHECYIRSATRESARVTELTRQRENIRAQLAG